MIVRKMLHGFCSTAFLSVNRIGYFHTTEYIFCAVLLSTKLLNSFELSKVTIEYGYIIIIELAICDETHEWK